MPRGLANMSEGSGGGGKGLPFKKIMLGDDGETVRIRFLTDADEMYFDWFHKVQVPGKKWPGRAICLRSALQAECQNCIDEVPSVYEWMGWVYVYTHNMSEPGEGRTPVQVGKRTFYQEACNEARLMRYASFHKAAVKAKFERLGTLLDHEFEWCRTGARNDNKVTYQLETLDKSPFPKELAVIAKDLPDLEDIAFGRPINPPSKAEGKADEPSPFNSDAPATSDDEADNGEEANPFA